MKPPNHGRGAAMNRRDLGAWIAGALMFVTLVYAVGTLAIEGAAR